MLGRVSEAFREMKRYTLVEKMEGYRSDSIGGLGG